ncbi:MAG: DUF6597 domain-containing transcriptional factor [Jiangellaceae bacterium]
MGTGPTRITIVMWMVDWDLRRDEPFVHEGIPDPAIHLALKSGQSRLVGVCTGHFAYALADIGRIFGFRFRPGAFCSFVRTDDLGRSRVMGAQWRGDGLQPHRLGR